MLPNFYVSPFIIQNYKIEKTGEKKSEKHYIAPRNKFIFCNINNDHASIIYHLRIAKPNIILQV